MAKKNKSNWINLIFAIISPLLVFLGNMLYCYFVKKQPITLDGYIAYFKPFFEALKGYKDYIFPFIFCLAIGLIYLAICFIFKKKQTFIAKAFLFLCFLYIITVGSRILFIIVNKYSESAFDFIHDGITIYSISIASALDFVVMWFMGLFSGVAK